MAEFRPRVKKHNITITVNGKEYIFDCSPTNYSFVKSIASISEEAENASEIYNEMPKNNLSELAKSFDFLKEKEKAFVEAILPGKWDELFQAVGTDLLDMMELIGFMASEIMNKGAEAKRKEHVPEVPADGEQI